MSAHRESQTAKQVTILRNSADVAQAVAEEFATSARECVARSGRFTVALAGGTTPRQAYMRIAANEAANDDDASRLPWDKIHIFFGDERPVPPDDPQSNYRMARESLLSRVPIPPENVHRIRAELEAEAAARQYERELRDCFPGANPPSLDLVLLGMGPDGHTASLFPGTTALGEQSRFVVANWVEKLQQWRITMTLPVLNAATTILFTVVGTDKASVLPQVLSGDVPGQYPAQLVNPASGDLRWIIDEDAARSLPRHLYLQRSA